MRWRALLRSAFVVVVWLAALAGLIAIDPGSGLVYAIVGSLLTIAVGFVLNSFWVLPVPAVVAAVLIVPWYLASGDCYSCGDDGWSLVTWIAILLFVVPATVALGVGVVARTLVRGRRR